MKFYYLLEIKIYLYLKDILKFSIKMESFYVLFFEFFRNYLNIN